MQDRDKKVKQANMIDYHYQTRLSILWTLSGIHSFAILFDMPCCYEFHG